MAREKRSAYLVNKYKPRLTLAHTQAYVDYSDLGMDPEILRRNATANGKRVTTNGHATSTTILSAAAKAGPVTTVDSLTAMNGATGVPTVNGTNKIVSGVAA